MIVAAHQAANTIGEALASVFAQTVPAHEVIVCDDGSTDEIERAVAPFLDRITFLRKQNSGEASAKNAAARAAAGDFVVILDADDAFLPRRLERLAALAARQPELDILTTDAWLVLGRRRLRRCYTADWRFEFEEQRREILRRNFIFGLAAVRRERLLAVGGFDESITRTTDWDCWLRLILDGSRAGAVLEPLAHYTIHPDALSSDRLAMRRGALQTLTKARANPHLARGERTTIEESIAGYTREVRVLQAGRDLADRAPGVRRRMLALAAERGLPVRTRTLALGAAFAPRMAGRVQQRRAARSWTGAGGTNVTTE